MPLPAGAACNGLFFGMLLLISFVVGSFCLSDTFGYSWSWNGTRLDNIDTFNLCLEAVVLGDSPMLDGSTSALSITFVSLGDRNEMAFVIK